MVVVSCEVDLADYQDLQKSKVIKGLLRLAGTVVFDMSVSDSCVNVVDDIKENSLSPFNITDELWWCSTISGGFQAIDTLSYQQLEHGFSKDHITKKKYVIVQASKPCKHLFEFLIHDYFLCLFI